MPQEKDIASDCTSFATALGHAAPAAAQPASFPASATAPHTLTGEIDALKAVSKAVRDLDSLNLTQRKLFDRIEHTHNNIFIQGQAGTGKSTFIRRFMDEMVIPHMEDGPAKTRSKDDLPHAASGKKIMTT